MRKRFYSLVLIAAGLLIGTQGWAEIQEGDVCKIGDNGYATLQDAVNDVPKTGEATTIVMIANYEVEIPATLTDDDKVALNWSTNAAASNNPVVVNIIEGRNVWLDLNGKTISVTNSYAKSNWALIVGGKTGTMAASSLTIYDSSLPSGTTFDKDNGGKMIYTSLYNGNCSNGELIRNQGMLNIKSGCFYCHASENTAGFCVDNMNNSNAADNVCTIEGGYFYSDWDCIRSWTNYSGTSKDHLSPYGSIVNINGGYFEGVNGIVFVQDAAFGKEEINIAGGYFDSGKRPVIRIWTDASLKDSQTDDDIAKFKNQITGLNINISGGVANVDALYIQHNVYNSGDKNEDVKTLEATVAQFQEDYKNVFNITGGTFASENYQIASDVLVGKDPETGETHYEVKETVSTQVYTLPTLLDGKLIPEPSHILPPDQYKETEITIVVAYGKDDVTGAEQLDNAKEYAVVKQDLDITGKDATAYSLMVQNNATVTVRDGAILTIGQGGVVVEEGSKIIVEAGGILRIGDRGFEGTGANALIVKTDLNKSGVVSIIPNAYLNDAPQLTIEMASRCFVNDEGNRWQYFAIPTQGASLQLPGGVNTWMYNYDVDAQDWHALSQKSQVNEPFRGYIMTNNSASTGVVYTMQGNMNGRDDAVLKLEGDADEGENWNFLGNSYLAPIKIETFLNAVKVMDGAAKVERTIFIHEAVGGNYEAINLGDLEGESEESTKTVIPPMNAFFMNLINSESANVLLDYSECVYGNEVTTAMYAPSRQQGVKTNKMNIVISGGANVDKIRFFEDAKFSDAFDNDYEASKLMNDGVNIYAVVNEKNLSSVADKTLDGTQLNFQADDAVEYTMTIANNNCDGYVLVDNLTNAQVAMTDGATYTFVATPNETVENRFEIRKAGGVVTNLAEMKAAHAVKGIYTAAGQYVGKADRWNTLPAGMYIVDGVRMAK